MSKKLSIIVPVYNMAAEGKLNYCLDSLVGQTIRGLYDYEILCVDDASTDDSLEICWIMKKISRTGAYSSEPCESQTGRCEERSIEGGGGRMDRLHRQR